MESFSQSNNEFVVDNIRYLITSENTVAVKYTEKLQRNEVVVPETVAHGGISYNVTEIGAYAFLSRQGINELIIPDGVKIVEKHAFDESDVSSFVIGKGLCEASPDAFTNCPKREKITVSSDNKYFDSRGNCNALIGDDKLICGTSLTSVPQSVNWIEQDAFRNCAKLKTLIIDEWITRIGTNAFRSCTGLEELRYNAVDCFFPSEAPCDNDGFWWGYWSPFLYDVNARASDVIRLNSVVFGEHVKVIPVHLLEMQDELTSVKCLFDDPEQVTFMDDITPFLGVSDKAVLYVPNSALQAFRQSAKWSAFKIVKGIDGCGTPDLNGDGVVAVADISIAINQTLGRGDPRIKDKADINGDGEIDMKDVNLIINAMLAR